ncbi:hypothetical protein A2276_02630 [candidate division WOR-1 bacterium RIFOXYA12_FULL_43_27]|uniref:Uncharacterized protein n=1 Tax=candidate division WOR-1 bacterium RIFOXYC2_FULL_46_14 TaxID=1802587 RepID=A0A1F4U7T3_UNCSA|nr:MAG: hypothetical protein A2276_02630 [candidate division WOR-1 bacterium RIFOXYA12_FULL_43_27]OGC19392.1 MAG: hypothetical protein A2292_01700 [candidate division WOR-1 bacterium RIFOXYB2_FULL_46_45]OGC30381.1 MAG: hypothetical protein A2232_01700 [candidate division WOR-1 bacterium RIFOXYA2_FULL_46_56]OGC40981.1 MAG: hypothetical protein A2438_01700 [candidate division WOR-1 bacterium RIFOXYC2_FULL_46_14]
MNLGGLVVPLGIITYFLVLLTILSGLLHFKLNYHKTLAALTILFASLHAGLIIYFKFFR